MFELREYKVCGRPLPGFLRLIGTAVALPTVDVWSDWALCLKWYLAGDIR